MIRTQELLAATRGYGVKLYFTSAKILDFSKTPGRNGKIWGDQVLADMVRVIRTFRPNIVINNFGGVHSGHGHHQAAGLWDAQKQYNLPPIQRTDATMLRKSSQLKITIRTPLPKNLGAAKDHPVQVLDIDRGGGSPTRAGQLPAFLLMTFLHCGETWREIGIDAFANHVPKGFSLFLGSTFLHRPIGLVSENGEKIDPASLARPLHTLAGDAEGDGCARGASFCPILKHAQGTNWKKRVRTRCHCAGSGLPPKLLSAAKDVTSLYPGGARAAHWVAGRSAAHRTSFRATPRRSCSCLGCGPWKLSPNRTAARLWPVSRFTVDAGARCRKESGCELGKLQLVVRAQSGSGLRARPAAAKTKINCRVMSAEPALTAWEKQQPEPPL